ncbi:MAG: hypothetical protein KIS78_15080, partial [Labilithrix sp.]|nr:hypothetical protein [Labilithrix sp.]
GAVIAPEHLHLDPARDAAAPVERSLVVQPRDDDERRRIVEALARCGGNQTRAAELIGVSRRTLVNRHGEYGIARPLRDRRR